MILTRGLTTIVIWPTTAERWKNVLWFYCEIRGVLLTGGETSTATLRAEHRIVTPRRAFRPVARWSMGNIVAGGDPAPHSPSRQLRLRRGKKSAGCPCFLSEQASLWEALTLHEKFRPYVLRHLLDEGFICSVLEHGERENSLSACDGVLYFKVSGFIPKVRYKTSRRKNRQLAGHDCNLLC